MGGAWRPPVVGDGCSGEVSRQLHIPDGYLSPFFSVGSGVVTVPAWSVAAARLRQSLRGRSVPMLALLSAFSFALMLVSFPVPGGTTAHAVGGTLIAIVVGP